MSFKEIETNISGNILFPSAFMGTGVCHTYMDSAPPVPNSVNMNILVDLLEFSKPANNTILTGLLRKVQKLRITITNYINNIECLLMFQNLLSILDNLGKPSEVPFS